MGEQADWIRCMEIYGPPVVVCAGGRLVVSGYICPHCGSESPNTNCLRPKRRSTVKKG